MLTSADVKAAFATRPMPDVVTERDSNDSDAADALVFESRNWQEIDPEDWEDHYSALYAFTPSAFIYYLPSLLCSTLIGPHSNDLAVDVLIGLLDRSPEPEFWDDFFKPRIVGLSLAELEALESWIVIQQRADSIQVDQMQRARDTITLVMMTK